MSGAKGWYASRNGSLLFLTDGRRTVYFKESEWAFFPLRKDLPDPAEMSFSDMMNFTSHSVGVAESIVRMKTRISRGQDILLPTISEISRITNSSPFYILEEDDGEYPLPSSQRVASRFLRQNFGKR